jgi:hypothetical protein
MKPQITRIKKMTQMSRNNIRVEAKVRNPWPPMVFVKGKDNFSQKSFPRQLPARYALNANLASSFPAVPGFLKCLCGT